MGHHVAKDIIDNSVKLLAKFCIDVQNTAQAPAVPTENEEDAPNSMLISHRPKWGWQGFLRFTIPM